MSEPISPDEVHLVVDENAQELAGFEPLFRHFYPRLLRFLSKFLDGSSVDPEDVAQESMVKAWAQRERFDPRYQFSTWVYTIARRTATDHLRKQRWHESSSELNNLHLPNVAPEDSIVAEETVIDLWSTAERVLSSPQYAALWLRYREDMSVREVAKALSKSSVSTRVLLHRARATLQPHLDSDQRADSTHRAADSPGDSQS